jgi:hypothetical protein
MEGDLDLEPCCCIAPSRAPDHSHASCCCYRAGLPHCMAPDDCGCLQWRRLSARQEEALLPRALACGQLSETVRGATWCYLSTPLGTHMDEADPPSEILGAMAKIARGLGRLHEHGRLLHRLLFCCRRRHAQPQVCSARTPYMWPSRPRLVFYLQVDSAALIADASFLV